MPWPSTRTARIAGGCRFAKPGGGQNVVAAQRPIDATNIDRDQMGRYLQEFVDRGGFTGDQTVDPAFVGEFVGKMREGKVRTVEAIEAREQELAAARPVAREAQTVRRIFGRRGTAAGPAAKFSMPEEREFRPVVDPSGTELGEFGGDTRALRKAAVTWYQRNLQHGAPARRPDLKNVFFTKHGRDEFESFSANPDKLKMVVALRQIVEGGDLQDPEPPDHKRNDGIIRFYPIDADVLLSGKEYRVRVMVGEDELHNKFFDLFPSVEEYKTKKASRGFASLEQSPGSPEGLSGGVAAPTKNIAPADAEVNPPAPGESQAEPEALQRGDRVYRKGKEYEFRAFYGNDPERAMIRPINQRTGKSWQADQIVPTISLTRKAGKYSLPDVPGTARLREALDARGLNLGRMVEHAVKYWPAGGKPAEDIIGDIPEGRDYLQRVERAWWEARRRIATWSHPLNVARRGLSRADDVTQEDLGARRGFGAAAPAINQQPGIQGSGHSASSPPVGLNGAGEQESSPAPGESQAETKWNFALPELEPRPHGRPALAQDAEWRATALLAQFGDYPGRGKQPDNVIDWVRDIDLGQPPGTPWSTADGSQPPEAPRSAADEESSPAPGGSQGETKDRFSLPGTDQIREILGECGVGTDWTRPRLGQCGTDSGRLPGDPRPAPTSSTSPGTRQPEFQNRAAPAESQSEPENIVAPPGTYWPRKAFDTEKASRSASLLVRQLDCRVQAVLSTVPSGFHRLAQRAVPKPSPAGSAPVEGKYQTGQEGVPSNTLRAGPADNVGPAPGASQGESSGRFSLPGTDQIREILGERGLSR